MTDLELRSLLDRAVTVAAWATQMGEAMRELKEETETLRAALEQFADPRNWSINRYSFDLPVCCWIGERAELSDPIGYARSVLARLGDAKETA